MGDPGPGRHRPAAAARDRPFGGGTLGRTYANNNWIYGLWRDNQLQLSGADLRSGAMGKTHHQMAVLLGEYLADDEQIDEPARRRLAAWVEQQCADEYGH